VLSILDCAPLLYFDPTAVDAVYTRVLPTLWWGVRMSPEWIARIDTAYFKFGILHNPPSQEGDTLEVRILDSTLPKFTVLDSISIRIPSNLQGLVQDSYYIAELDANTPATISPPRDFWLSWRLRGAATHTARIFFKHPAINPSRSVVINPSGTTTSATNIVRLQIPDSVDLWAETRVCYTSGRPVELSSFSAVYFAGKTTLTWKTATEENNYGFQIERLAAQSSNNTLKLWEQIGFYPGRGTTSLAQQYSFIDQNPKAGMDLNGVVTYRLVQIDFNGKRTNLPVQRVSIPGVDAFPELMQNFPNPVYGTASTTEIGFTLPSAMHVSLCVNDVLGRTVAILVDDVKEQGLHTVMMDTHSLRPGQYFYTLQSGGRKITKSMIVSE
jgi:hypothetical protein